MYLTRFKINKARREAKKLLGSPHAMHAAVLASYPNVRESTEGRVLWRVDRADHDVWLYIASPDEPDLAHLVEQAGWPSQSTVETRPYKPLLDALHVGDRWAFRLTANPTRTTRIGDSAKSQRVGHVTADHQLTWFTSRVDSWGICLPHTAHGPGVIVKDRRVWQFRRKGSTVTLSTATFDGELVIEDPDRLRTVLTSGIGPAKAYGCGLLTLAPVRDPG